MVSSKDPFISSILIAKSYLTKKKHNAGFSGPALCFGWVLGDNHEEKRKRRKKVDRSVAMSGMQVFLQTQARIRLIPAGSKEAALILQLSPDEASYYSVAGVCGNRYS
jgi:hypothetical protein